MPNEYMDLAEDDVFESKAHSEWRERTFDRFGHYKPQPGSEGYPIEALFDDSHAFLSRSDFENLPEYSASVPTGVVPTKTWKRLEDGVWWVGRYDPILDEKLDCHKVRTTFRKPVILIALIKS